VSKVILQKIQVLATAQNYEKSDETEAKVVSSATLAVTPQESEILILASDRGKIRLAMRSPREEAQIKTSGASPEFFAGPRPKPAPVAARAARPAQPKVITRTVTVPVPQKPDEAILVIRGTSTEKVYR
jgi:pilus assembly protein CpaB